MKKIFFIIIIVLTFILRFYRLGDYPALNADEAAIGYNAYSLLETGKDEHGNSWPVHFQSFNDYKPGLYFYLVMPFVKLIGLNEWAVRIPGAALGVLTVIVLYFLAKELFKDEKIALASGLFLAVSPWHIHFSRGGWEVNTATFFISLGTLMFLKAVKKSSLAGFLLSVLPFAAALYTYHAARIIVPLIGLGLTIIYKRDLFKKENAKPIFLGAVAALVLLIPLMRDLTGPAGISRAAGVGLFADQGPFNRVNEQRGEHNDFTSPLTKILHNKPVNYTLAFLQNWAEHFHGEFLFLSGDEIQRNRVPETGQMHLPGVVFIAFGILWLIRMRKEKGAQFVFYWLLISPVAAALTFQSPHALRAQNMTIPLALTASVGLIYLFEAFGKFGKARNYLIVSTIVISGLFFARYVHMYYVHMAKEYPFSSQYGVKELVSYLEDSRTDKTKKVMVTDRYDQPYILFLFYLKYDPAKFQREHALTARDQYGFSTVRSFDKYTFTSITDWDSTREEYKDALIAGTDEEIFEGTNVVKDIYGSNGYKYFQVVAN